MAGRVAPPIEEVAGTEIRIDSPLRPQRLKYKLYKSWYGQAIMTVTVPQDSNKRKVQSNEDTPCAKHPRTAGRSKSNKKQSE